MSLCQKKLLLLPGVDWRQFVNNMYFPSEGIFGITLWVVSTVVFHFVLFGVVAQRMGLGQFFVDNAMMLAGRYTGYRVSELWRFRASARAITNKQ